MNQISFEDLFEEENKREKVEVAETPVPLSPLLKGYFRIN